MVDLFEKCETCAPSRVLIIGGGGQVGQRLAARLCAQRRDRAVATVRPGKRAQRLVDSGARLVELDLTASIDHLPEDVDAVVFSAGAGGQGFDQTLLVDLWGARRMMDWASARGISRFVMVSSIGVDDPSSGPPFLRPYLAAKRAADDALMATNLDWTILRPGRLMDSAGAGRISTKRREYWPTVTRADVAETLYRAIDHRGLSRRVFDVYSGDTPIDDALNLVAGAPRTTRG